MGDSSASTSAPITLGQIYIPHHSTQATENLLSDFTSPGFPPYWPQTTNSGERLLPSVPHPYHGAGVQWTTNDSNHPQVMGVDVGAVTHFPVTDGPGLGSSVANMSGQHLEGPESEGIGAPSPVTDISLETIGWAFDATADTRGLIGRPESGRPSRNPDSQIQREDSVLGSQVTATYSRRDSVDHSFLRQAFPLDNEEHHKLRNALQEVMQSEWKQKNEFEPDGAALLQFMAHDDVEGRWYCLFWKEGAPCECSCRKKYHAKGHIRSHISLFPFVCLGPWCVELGL